MSEKITHGEAALQALSLSIQVSDRTRCNARCKFCISRTTPNCGAEEKTGCRQCDFDRLHVGLDFALQVGATHAILTGKADPLQEDFDYLKAIVAMSRNHLPLVDIHTNGLFFAQHNSTPYLGRLQEAGLTNITFSVASFDDQINRNLMGIKKVPCNVIDWAVELGLHVRCSLVLCREGVSGFSDIMDYIKTAGDLGVHAVVIRELWRPTKMLGQHREVYEYNYKNAVGLQQAIKIFDQLSTSDNQYGISKRDPLPWGTPVYVADGIFKNPDHGVNITFARCDEATSGRIIKSIIHKPNGHGYRNWDSNGDILY